MKKYIFMAVAGMLALSSCSNDDNDVQNTQNAPRQMTFTAGFGDGATTRATLDGSTKKVSFNAGDGISILSAKNTNKDFYTSEDGASATFEGTAYDDSEFYAIYPYTGGLELSGTTISGVLIPTNQSGAASSTCGWDPTAPIAYATTTGTSLQFHNACALLKITNGRGVANGIQVSCGEEALTGIFSLDTSSGALSGTGISPFAFAENVPSGKTIYIAIAPGTKTNFMAVWFGGGIYAKKEKSSFTFEAGKIYDLGNTSAWTEFVPVTDLSTINTNYIASNGETLTGTLASNVKIIIADGATVTLKDVNINGSGTWTTGEYAGITCEGDATIILNGTNTVKGFDGFYPGIYVPVGSTVTINGSGSLTASSNGGGAGIGGGWDIDCGNIEIQGGTITATAGNEAAGIGGGRDANCGNITISGGTVTATGGDYAAGIGSGTCSEASCGSITISGGTVTATGATWAAGIGSSAFGSSCGAITITSGVTHVTATKGEEAPNSIGAGDMGSSCGTVSIEDPSKVTEN